MIHVYILLGAAFVITTIGYLFYRFIWKDAQ